MTKHFPISLQYKSFETEFEAYRIWVQCCDMIKVLQIVLVY